jgi:hypothetical protein
MGIRKVIVAEDASQVELFAAGELARYLERMTGEEVRTVIYTSELEGDNAYLGSAALLERPQLSEEMETLDEDGFLIKEAEGDLFLLGANDRGTLYAAYHLLQMLGARWYFPSPSGEFIPELSELNLAGLEVKENPSFSKRGIVIYRNNSAFMDWLDFAPKVKLNLISLHSLDGIEEMEYLTRDNGLLFGLEMHFYGDVISLREREIDRNRERTRVILELLPDQVTELHLWPADSVLKPERGLEMFSISDLTLAFTNEMCRFAREIRPGCRMAFLAYWSTWEAPRRIKPTEGVFLEMAPIHRSFSYPVNAPPTTRNCDSVRSVIEDLLEVFDPAEAQVLGYWLDSSLFRRGRFKPWQGRLPQLGGIMRQDLSFYHSLGIRYITTFAVGVDGGYLARFTSPTIFIYPMLLWDLQADIRSEIRLFCRNYFGTEEMAQFFMEDEGYDPADTTGEELIEQVGIVEEKISKLREIRSGIRDEEKKGKILRFEAELFLHARALKGALCYAD